MKVNRRAKVSKLEGMDEVINLKEQGWQATRSDYQLSQANKLCPYDGHGGEREMAGKMV